MKVSIIVIGDEILLGRVTDTNSGFLSRTIDPLGWQVTDIATVADSREEIVAAVRRAMTRSDIVLTTGGLGPTRDDITKQALIDCFGGTLREDRAVVDNARSIMESRGLRFNDLTATQGLVPDSCEAIVNTVGTAPLMLFRRDGHTLVAMPGVPAETRTMFPAEVLPRLIRLHQGARPVFTAHRSLLVGGIPESAIAEHLAPWEDTLPAALHLAYLPDSGIVRLRLDGIGPDRNALDTLIDDAHASLARLVSPWLLDTTDRPLAQIVIDTLRDKGLMLATAESCTGGNIAHTLTLVPGSSASFAGSVVAYSNTVKETVLGVDPAAIAAYGAVSIPVAEQMARGALDACHADIAVSTTGIAGPGGAVPGKPVGTVCIAVATPAATVSATHRFAGDRERIIHRATIEALASILRQLR